MFSSAVTCLHFNLPGVLGSWESCSITFFPPTTLNILRDFGNMAIGSEDAVYSQDVGPYSFQKEGKYKLYWSKGQLSESTSYIDNKKNLHTNHLHLI